ncbi:hypothetical protein SEVIR_2G342233v4 [Setaria viridis]
MAARRCAQPAPRDGMIRWRQDTSPSPKSRWAPREWPGGSEGPWHLLRPPGGDGRTGVTIDRSTTTERFVSACAVRHVCRRGSTPPEASSGGCGSLSSGLSFAPGAAWVMRAMPRYVSSSRIGYDEPTVVMHVSSENVQPPVNTTPRSRISIRWSMLAPSTGIKNYLQVYSVISTSF